MKNKKNLLSVLLAAVLLCACVAGMLVTGVSAEEPTHKVLEVDGVGASGSGKYKTVTAALRSVSSSSWAPGSTLTIEISVVATSGEGLTKIASASSMFNVFGVQTLFVSDGTKLPITIRSEYVAEGENESRSSLRFLNWGYSTYSYFFSNDYTFENIDLYFSKNVQTKWNTDGSRQITARSDYLYAGSGEVTFKNVRFCRSNYQYKAADSSDTSTTQQLVDYTINSRNTTFYGDLSASALGAKKSGSSDHMNGLFYNWDADKFTANAGEDGLLKVGFTFDNTNYFTAGSNVGSPSPQAWQRSHIAASYGAEFSFSNEDFSITNEDIHSYITVTGNSLVTRVNGFRSNPAIIAPAKISLNVKGNATVYGIFADSGNGGGYHDGNYDAYIENPRKVNVEINVSENAIVKGNNGTKADSCSISGVTDATYTADSKVVINILGGTIEEEVIAVGGHNIATGRYGEKFYNLPLNTAGEFEINIRGGVFADSIYGIYSKNIYNCHTLRGTVDVNLYAPVDKAVYGVYSDATDEPNYEGTIDESEKGKGSVVADGAKVTVNVLSGTHTQAIYGIGGGAGAVEAGGEISLVLNGATVEGTFGLGEGTDYAVEAGAIASYYLTKGSVPAALVPVSVGSKSAEVDTFAAGSTLSIEVGDLNYVASADETYPTLIKNAYIGGNVEVLFNGNVSFPVCHESKTTVRLLYSCYIGGNYTLDIKPEAGKSIVSKVPFQTSYSSYIGGNSTVTVDGGTEKNVRFEKDFFGATGYNTIQSLSNAMFDAGIYSDRSGATGRGYRDTAADGANDVTWNLNNITAKYFYPSQYNVAGGGMNIYGKLTNNIENSEITGTSYMGSYRSYYKDSKGAVTQTVPVINEIENNFKGGNTFSGTVYCGGRTANQSTPAYGSTGKIVNKISGTNSFGTFYAGADANATYHSESIGSIDTTIEDGSTFGSFYAGSKYAWYKDGVESSITTTINGGTFKGAVYAGNPSGTAANTQTLTITGGTFKGVVDGDSVALNGNVSILEGGQINADTVGENVTVTKTDSIGAFDKVYVTAPAGSTANITFVVEGNQPIIIDNETNGYQVRGWYLPVSATLILTDRVEVKLTMSNALADEYVSLLGESYQMAITFDTETAGAFEVDPDDSNLLYTTLQGRGAKEFDLPIEYQFGGVKVVSMSICDIAEAGAEMDGATAEQKALFKALYDYGVAANNLGELKYFTEDAKAALGALVPECAVPENGAGAVNFKSMTLLMGDTIGIRLKTSNVAALKAITKVEVNGIEIPSGTYVISTNEAETEAYLDLFVHAEKYNTKLSIQVYDANETACVTVLETSVSKIATAMAALDLSEKVDVQRNVQSVVALVLAVHNYKTAA